MFYWKNVDTGNVIESEVEPPGEWIEIDQDEYEALAHPLTKTIREQGMKRTDGWYCKNCGWLNGSLWEECPNCKTARPQ